ncbi:DUF2300 domain-containing protein [Massilia horti]|uniref:DUF2300 domain-containing protein n=1 Tax=Massilia horti TaxID=2562153 RepID=A0A4Y9T3W2_9BURK|nr:DUF2300 domain-containing protein [Massilia horti]TFW32383.1 DUF2300 domain-containing protein [Massilia horti]
MRRLLPVLLLAACAPLTAATLDVAWLRDGKFASTQLHQGGTAMSMVDADTEVPLGSLWKLFVYLYAVDTGLPMPDYHCTGRLPDESYCCEAGGSVDRNAALAQSCGLFFAPDRLMLSRAPWQRYWTGRLRAALAGEFAWMADPAQLSPGRIVRLGSLLRVLDAVSPASRAEAEAALLRVVLDGRGADTVRWFGSRLRVKTFSWHQPARPKERLGGAAGWLADGTPIWFAGSDTSSGIFQRWAPHLAAALPPVGDAADSGCVVVDFFTRYPVRGVRGPNGPAAPGPLNGRYVVEFENGKRLAFRSTGEMTLAVDSGGRPRVQGRFGVNEYVGRVLDREGNAAQPEAAKALAVAARTYLQQNARLAASCQQINDSSATQRVSPNPASAGALSIARWTDRLVIEGTPVTYHRDSPAPGRLAWTQAVEEARAGRWFDAILAQAYPNGVLGTSAVGGQRCQRLHDNEEWLSRMLPRWERVLGTQPGYERPAQLPLVCALAAGAPYSEQSRNRIFMRPLATREDRITLAHEYVHIGLRRHPRGHDEAYVEQLARRLADLNLERL